MKDLSLELQFHIAGIPITPTTVAICGILVIFSAISWFVLCRKLIAFAQLGRTNRWVLAQIGKVPLRQLEDALGRANEPSAYSRILSRALEFGSRAGAVAAEPGKRRSIMPVELEALRGILDKEIAAERSSLGRGLGWLPVTVSVAPLLGLLGTVTGIMTTFIGIQAANRASITAVAPGISEALVTTVVGLVVAIPAAIAHHTLAGKINDLEDSLEGFSHEIVNGLVNEARP